MSEQYRHPDQETGQPSSQVPTVWGAPSQIVPAGSPDARAVDPVQLGGEGAAPKPGKRLSTTAKTLTAVGVAAVIAVGGTIAITSANATTSTASQLSGAGTAPGVSAASGGSSFTGGRPGVGGFGEMAVIGGALHGEFVVPDGTATVTERIQTGLVTAMSSTGLSVKSSDGFSATYVLGSGVDVSAFPAGTDVTVIAKVSGSTVTAISVTAARSSAAAGGPGGSVSGAVPNGSGGGGAAGSGSGVGTGSGTLGSGQPTV